jgi:hypothetical protein
MPSPRSKSHDFVVCLSNEGFEASLEKRKLYVVVPESGSESLGLIRIIDESGEDYLYPAALFRPIDLSADLRRALREAS